MHLPRFHPGLWAELRKKPNKYDDDLPYQAYHDAVDAAWDKLTINDPVIGLLRKQNEIWADRAFFEVSEFRAVLFFSTDEAERTQQREQLLALLPKSEGAEPEPCEVKLKLVDKNQATRLLTVEWPND